MIEVAPMSDRPAKPDVAPSKSQGYVSFPAKYLSVVLLLQGLAFLSERYRWFHQDKGHTVLIAVAATLLLLMTLAVVTIVSRWFQRKTRLTLATLMLMVPVTTVPCGWLAWEMELARRQQELVASLEARGAVVAYEGPGPLYWPVHGKGSSRYLADTFKDDFFFDATYVGMGEADESDFERFGRFPLLKILRLRKPHVTHRGLSQLAKLEHLAYLELDEAHVVGTGLEKIQHLPHLQRLSLRKTDVTDAEIEVIAKFRHLEWLSLQDTEVTLEGVKRIRKALPNCRVVVSFQYPQQ